MRRVAGAGTPPRAWPASRALGAVGVLVAALLAPGVAVAGVADTVEPCDGGAASDLLHYCCKKERNVPLLLLTDSGSGGYAAAFFQRAKEVLGAHNVSVYATYGGDGTAEPSDAENLAELCEDVIYQLTGSIDKLKYKLPVVFTSYHGSPQEESPDSYGIYYEDLQASCEPAIREWFSDVPEHLQWLLDNLDHYQAVVINTYKIADGQCLEALPHEIGHAHGLGHTGDTSNVMSSCERGVAHDGLDQIQVSKLCTRRDFNNLITLP